jgi:hypothetical protein
MGNHIDATMADKKGTSLGSATKRCRTCGEVFITNHYCQGPKSETPTGIIDMSETALANCLDHKQHNVGTSNYAKFSIQPWDIWREYSLNPWDADIIKRTLRTKEGDSRKLDYEKIIHICQERIAQLDGAYNNPTTKEK